MMAHGIRFREIPPASSEWDVLSDLLPLWQDRFGQASVLSWSSDGAPSWEEVVAAYRARHAPHVGPYDFWEVSGRAAQLRLVRGLYVHGGAGTGSAARAFARAVADLVGQGGALFTNASVVEEAPEYDLSTAAGVHLARCACVVFVTATWIGHFEVVLDTHVDA